MWWKLGRMCGVEPLGQRCRLIRLGTMAQTQSRAQVLKGVGMRQSMGQESWLGASVGWKPLGRNVCDGTFGAGWHRRLGRAAAKTPCVSYSAEGVHTSSGGCPWDGQSACMGWQISTGHVASGKENESRNEQAGGDAEGITALTGAGRTRAPPGTPAGL